MKEENISQNLFKSHFISVLDNTLKITWVATILIITNFAIIVNKVNEFNKNINVNILIIIFLTLFVTIMFIYYFIMWKITSISYNKDKIIIYKSLVVRDLSEFLIKNISGLVIEQNILEKFFKVCRVKIYTDQLKKKKEDMQIIVKKDIADKLKHFILERFGVLGNDEKLKSNTYDMNIKLNNIMLHSFFNISIGNIVILLNVFWIIFTMIAKGTLMKEVLYDFIGFTVTILSITLPIIYSIISSILKFYKFKLKRIKDILLVRFGLFTTKNYIIPIGKINGINFTETLISRVFNYKLVKVICSGVATKKNELDFLIPMMSRKKIDQVLELLFPNHNLKITQKLKKQPIFTFGIYLFIFSVIDFIIIPVLMYLRLPVYIIIGYMMLSIFLLIVLYMFKKISIEDEYILVSTGFYIKKMSILLYDKIKYIKISDGAMSSNFNIYNVNLYILSGFNSVRTNLGYISRTNLSKIKRKILR